MFGGCFCSFFKLEQIPKVFGQFLVVLLTTPKFYYNSLFICGNSASDPDGRDAGGVGGAVAAPGAQGQRPPPGGLPHRSMHSA